MAAGSIEIKVFGRTTGKNDSRNLRREHRVPAVVYGAKVESSTCCVTELDARRYSSQKFDNQVFVLKSEENKKLNDLKVLKKATAFHKVTQMPIHIDFYAIDVTKTVRVNVAIKYEGKAEGTREGGVFNAIRRDVEIECLPTEIPENIVIDITPLQLNSSFHVSDLKVPENMKVLTALTDTICNVAEVKEEVVVEVAAAVDPAAPAAAGAPAAPGAAPAAPGAAAPAAAAGKDAKAGDKK